MEVTTERRSEDRKTMLQQGFTLVELLIVIVILGILAGIVVFAVSNLTSDAGKNACKTERSTVESAAEAFKAKAGTYPTLDQLQADTVINGVTVEALLKAAPKYAGATDPGFTYDPATGTTTETANCS